MTHVGQTERITQTALSNFFKLILVRFPVHKLQ